MLTISNFLLCIMMAPISGFVVHQPLSTTSRTNTKQVRAVPQNIEKSGLFASEGWGPIKKELNVLPVFACANEKGNPLQYNLKGQLVAFFFCDIEAAKVELSKASAETKIVGLDLVPFPLGDVYEMAAQGKAVMIPSQAAINAAGAPPGTNPIGLTIPLFACMDIMRERENGQAVLPLFMVLEEAQAAVKMALDIDGGDPADFEVVGLSLNRAVELLATDPESLSYQFIPPASSVEYIRAYLE